MFRGVLCEAAVDLHDTGRHIQDVAVLIDAAHLGVSAITPVIKRGELVTYIGRTVVNGKYGDHKFLTAKGVYLASPSCFKCALDAQDDENNMKP